MTTTLDAPVDEATTEDLDLHHAVCGYVLKAAHLAGEGFAAAFCGELARLPLHRVVIGVDPVCETCLDAAPKHVAVCDCYDTIKRG